MRISDWSSDVCSSDLLSRENGFVRLHRRDAAEADMARRAVHRLGRTRGGAVALAVIDRAQMRATFQHLAADQNGRATCRERVCQYESISLVGGSIKTKKTNARHTQNLKPRSTFMI